VSVERASGLAVGDVVLMPAGDGLNRVHPGSMESRKAAEPRNTASAEHEALAARERTADERERMAGEREAAADERERKADQRERDADRREAVLTQRQQEIDERERELDRRRRALGEAVETLEQRTLETIERSRALLALSGQRLNRAEASVMRTQARRERHQADIDRAAAETEREWVAMLPDPGESIERAKTLRKKVLAAMEAFAANEDEAARVHEQLAAMRPEHRGEYRRTAERARTVARRARQVLGTFAD
jgi:hypothetical protein